MPARGSAPLLVVRPYIAVGAEPDIEQELPSGDGILHIRRVLIDVGRPVELEQAPAARQVEGHQPGDQVRVGA